MVPYCVNLGHPPAGGRPPRAWAADSARDRAKPASSDEEQQGQLRAQETEAASLAEALARVGFSDALAARLKDAEARLSVAFLAKVAHRKPAQARELLAQVVEGIRCRAGRGRRLQGAADPEEHQPGRPFGWPG